MAHEAIAECVTDVLTTFYIRTEIGSLVKESCRTVDFFYKAKDPLSFQTFKQHGNKLKL